MRVGMVDILLATYNGEKYLRKQIESILNQTYDMWHLLIRDDGSSDATKKIIKEYVCAYPSKIENIEDNRGNVGVVRNFKSLLQRSEHEYIMFCDQDDIWDHNKISREVKVMKEAEAQNNLKPILVFSDLREIDSEENILVDSFNTKNRFSLDKIILSQILFRNVVTGCTMLINKFLANELLNMPDDIKMHDHWVTLACLVNNGCIRYINTPTVSYRQHSGNVIGDKSLSKRDIIKKIFGIADYNEGKKKTVTYYKKVEYQIHMLYKLYKEQISKKNKEMLEDFDKIWIKPPGKRIYYLFKYRCFQKRMYDNLLLIMYFYKWGSNSNNLK